MNPYLQDILHNITTRLAKLEEAQPKKEWVGLMAVKDTGESSLQLVFETREQADNAKAKLKEKNER